MQPTQKIWSQLSSATQSQYEMILCFLFFENLHFNGHFPDFGRPYWIEDINRKCLFAIPYKVIRWKTLYIILMKHLTNIEDVRVPQKESKIFKKWEKYLLKMQVKSFMWIFIKIGPTVWLQNAVTDTLRYYKYIQSFLIFLNRFLRYFWWKW